MRRIPKKPAVDTTQQIIKQVEKMEQDFPIFERMAKLSAKTLAAKYAAFVAEGFTTEQAFALCKGN